MTPEQLRAGIDIYDAMRILKNRYVMLRSSVEDEQYYDFKPQIQKFLEEVDEAHVAMQADLQARLNAL